MRKLLTALLMITGLAAQTASAQVASPAFVPENGFWYAPSQPGRGFAIEQQDDYLFITIYTYTNDSRVSQREPIWYSAQGSWSPPRSSDSVAVYEFDSPIYVSEDGQCIGCSFVTPDTSVTNLDLSIQFDSPWQAQMQLGPESIDIERFWFSNSIADATNAMLGQWKVVRDYTQADDELFPFEADILIFDERRTRDGEPFVSGFQATTGLAASGAFNEAEDLYVFVIEEASDLYLAYYTYGNSFGTNRFGAYAERFRPGDDLTFRGFPAEAFRSANRSFVETSVFGSKANKQNTTVPVSKPLLRANNPQLGKRQVIAQAKQQQQIQATVDRLMTTFQ